MGRESIPFVLQVGQLLPNGDLYGVTYTDFGSLPLNANDPPGQKPDGSYEQD